MKKVAIIILRQRQRQLHSKTCQSLLQISIALKFALSNTSRFIYVLMGSKYSKATNSISDASNSFESYRFPLEDLEEATNNFDDKFFIGEGAFGKVYRGVLRDGTKVALKRHNRDSGQSIEPFRTEIEILSRRSHPHLVSLIGFCDERNEMILIYDYMENGNLKSHLYGSDLPTMSWEQRLEICIGAARGLHYLHTSAVIHRDVKSTNILLDENFVAKITDFGISKKGTELDQTHVSTDVKGTFGYLDPEYFIKGRLTEKSDVYSFGVVLFEVLCARPAIGRSHMISLAEWAVETQKMGQLEQIVDPSIVAKIRPESLRMFGETAVKCLASSSENRPSMGDVLWKLEYALHLQEPIIQDNPE
ncbi:receptor-like protein kinase HERK 1 isoform X1 [Solanum pennellii]|uniref:Receptor-like protein kinase HERK 1 isoform X1 n=1 Tax=Solanum pennellii TaxID=28526 RepID=A0ABM1VAX3_SOLPN|nr:receptor-like protein kinase HERK 1 isoform X1 [Solanum pennellii]